MYIPRDRRQQIWDLVSEILRFSVTVACAAMLSVWIQTKLSNRRSHPIAVAQVPPHRAGFGHGYSVHRPISEGPSDELSDFYSKYLDEVLKTLRADRRVRMVRLELPNAVLNYQRFLASQPESGSSMRLLGRGDSIPVIAVSRGSKDFLEEMRVTYVDPKSLPAQLLESKELPLGASAIQQYLLVPDLSGANAQRFYFALR
jgi:hypothetical protein